VGEAGWTPPRGVPTLRENQIVPAPQPFKLPVHEKILPVVVPGGHFVGLLVATQSFPKAQSHPSTPPSSRRYALIRRIGCSARRVVEIAKQGNVDLLFLGDSITDFWRRTGSNVWNQYYTTRHAAISASAATAPNTCSGA